MPRFELINNRLCLSTEAIIDASDDDQRASKTIRQGLYRNKNGEGYWEHYPDPSDRRRKWIVYETLPSVTRRRVDDFYEGDLWGHYYAEKFIEKLNEFRDLSDRVWFHEKIQNEYFALTGEAVTDLLEACGWLRMLSSKWQYDKFRGKTHYYTQAAKLIATRNLHGLKISNWRALDRKVKGWELEGRSVLLSKKFKNDNARKLQHEAKIWLVNAYMNPLKPTILEVTRHYRVHAEKNGWEKLSYERVRQILKSSMINQAASHFRDGEAKSRENERTIKRRKPSFPDAMWSIDGLTVQLRYTEDGKVRSDLYAVIVMDVHSDKVVGLAMGATETATLVQAALRDAGRKTGHLPWQLQYDNSSANQSKEVQDLMKRLAKYSFPTAPYNGKSKPIENLIGRLERLYMRYLPNFKGGNITSPSMGIKANPDFLKQQQKNGDLPNLLEAMKQFELVVETHNHSAGDNGLTPNDRYRRQHDKRITMDVLTMVEIYWVERKYQARYTKDGLTIEVNKVRHVYEVTDEKGMIEDLEFKKQYLGAQFTIKYDPDDLDYIHLYKDAVWIAMASRKKEVAMARVDYNEADGKIILESQAYRKKEIQWKKEYREGIRKELDEMEILDDMSYLTVHKDALNKMEKNKLDELLEGAAVVPVSRKKNKVVDLHDDVEADGSIIED